MTFYSFKNSSSLSSDVDANPFRVDSLLSIPTLTINGVRIDLNNWPAMSNDERQRVCSLFDSVSTDLPHDIFLNQLRSTHGETLGLMRKLGIHPNENDPLYNPFSNEKVNDNFSNIGRHSIAVAGALDVLLTALSKKFPLDKELHDSMVRAALLHDATKPASIYARMAMRAKKNY